MSNWSGKRELNGAGRTETVRRRKKIVLLIASISGTLVSLSLIVASVSSEPSFDCEPRDHKPAYEKANYVKTSDNKNLIGLAGYIIYQEGSRQVFVPLHLESADTRETHNASVYVELSAGCANIGITSLRQSGFVAITSAQVDLSRTTGLNACNLDDLRMKTFTNVHYKCERSMNYTCSSGKSAVASIVLTKFEFEIGGDPEQIARYRFSTPPAYY